MKRLLQKYFYILLIIPIILVLQGCNGLAGIVQSGGDIDEDDISQSLILDDTNSALDNLKKQKEAQAAGQTTGNGDEITLSDTSGSFDIDSGGRTSPFVPYKERNLTYNSLNFGDLPLPPASGEVDENISTLITAKVTGILYDPSSPSAIINVLDDDYLVKSGDKVESFEIASIQPTYVAIKTGANVYRAKVGDIVDGELYGTGIYNLGHRFAGLRHPARKEDILFVQTKKKKESSSSGSSSSADEFSLPPIPDLGGILPRINLKTQAGDVPLIPPGVPKVDAN